MTDTDDDKTKPPEPFPDWVRWALWSALAVGGVYLLVKVMRRAGGAGVLMAAAAPAVALAAGRSAAQAEPIEIADLEEKLHEIAEDDPMIPPVQLFGTLRAQGVPLLSERHMARELRQLGLRSEVRTVTGRPERRWYDLTGYVTHE